MYQWYGGLCWSDQRTGNGSNSLPQSSKRKSGSQPWGSWYYSKVKRFREYSRDQFTGSYYFLRNCLLQFSWAWWDIGREMGTGRQGPAVGWWEPEAEDGIQEEKRKEIEIISPASRLLMQPPASRLLQPKAGSRLFFYRKYSIVKEMKKVGLPIK